MNTNFITVHSKTKEHKLSKIEYARWLCLIEAIDLIERKAQDLKSDMISDDFWIKPLAFQKYIDQRLETMILDVDREEFNISIDASITNNKHLFKPVIEEVATAPEEDEPVEIEPSFEEIAA